MPRNIARAGVVAGGLTMFAAPAAIAQQPLAEVASATSAHRQPLSLGAIKRAARTGKPLIVKGVGANGRKAHFQLRREGRWRTVASTRVRRDGRFRVVARHAGPLSAPARIVSGSETRRAGRMNVFRAAYASWYGPGLYGGHLACGGTLTPGTLGVANKSLPCGTKLHLRHGGRAVTVRVVDRGPYVAGREFDLTAATARKLRFEGTGTVYVTR